MRTSMPRSMMRRICSPYRGRRRPAAPRQFVDAGARKLALRGVEHRLTPPLVKVPCCPEADIGRSVRPGKSAWGLRGGTRGPEPYYVAADHEVVREGPAPPALDTGPAVGSSVPALGGGRAPS